MLLSILGTSMVGAAHIVHCKWPFWSIRLW